MRYLSGCLLLELLLVALLLLAGVLLLGDRWEFGP